MADDTWLHNATNTFNDQNIPPVDIFWVVNPSQLVLIHSGLTLITKLQ